MTVGQSLLVWDSHVVLFGIELVFGSLYIWLSIADIQTIGGAYARPSTAGAPYYKSN